MIFFENTPVQRVLKQRNMDKSWSVKPRSFDHADLDVEWFWDD